MNKQIIEAYMIWDILNEQEVDINKWKEEMEEMLNEITYTYKESKEIPPRLPLEEDELGIRIDEDLEEMDD